MFCDIKKALSCYARMYFPIWYNKRVSYKLYGKKLDLKHPITYSEKIQWMRFYYYPYNKLIIDCTDKYTVRSYVKDKIGEKYLVPLIGTWDKAEDIDWDKLPMKFILKCNHGCGYNLICHDKDKFDKKAAIIQLNKWMREDFAKISAEPHYAKIRRRIICEENLGKDINDYKFFCFNGEPRFLFVSVHHLDTHTYEKVFLNLDGTKAVFQDRDDKCLLENFNLPDNITEMIEISRKLSQDFPFVRTDLYEVNGKIYFSELTFTPKKGYTCFEPDEYNRYWGDAINLEGILK